MDDWLNNANERNMSQPQFIPASRKGNGGKRNKQTTEGETSRDEKQNKGKSDGTETKGEPKKKKRADEWRGFQGARARGRERERKTRHKRRWPQRKRKSAPGKRGFLP